MKLIYSFNGLLFSITLKRKKMSIEISEKQEKRI